MSEREFRVRLRASGGQPPLAVLAPPTPELYEELCRAEIEDSALAAQAQEPNLTDVAVELDGEYPETPIA